MITCNHYLYPLNSPICLPRFVPSSIKIVSLNEPSVYSFNDTLSCP